MTEHEKLLQEWKDRLGLHDWRIKLADNCCQNDRRFGKGVCRCKKE